MGAEVFERARPHLTDLGAVAGDELDALAAVGRSESARAARLRRARAAAWTRWCVHPAYRRMEEIAFSRFGLAAMAHRPGVLGWPGRAPQVVKYALSYLFAQREFGLLCPVNMTDSCARMLGAFGSEELKARYLPHLTATEFDALWQGTQWMTESTGGSDVGASTTVARRGADGQWRLWGDKWFTLGGQRGARADAGPARGGARGHARARDVPGAQAPARRQQERVDHQPAEGQAGLALDGHRRGDLRGGGGVRGGRARLRASSR